MEEVERDSKGQGKGREVEIDKVWGRHSEEVNSRYDNLTVIGEREIKEDSA